MVTPGELAWLEPGAGTYPSEESFHNPRDGDVEYVHDWTPVFVVYIPTQRRLAMILTRGQLKIVNGLALVSSDVKPDRIRW